MVRRDAQVIRRQSDYEALDKVDDQHTGAQPHASSGMADSNLWSSLIWRSKSWIHR
jgi:hypothetical protein